MASALVSVLRRMQTLRFVCGSSFFVTQHSHAHSLFTHDHPVFHRSPRRGQADPLLSPMKIDTTIPSRDARCRGYKGHGLRQEGGGKKGTREKVIECNCDKQYKRKRERVLRRAAYARASASPAKRSEAKFRRGPCLFPHHSPLP